VQAQAARKKMMFEVTKGMLQIFIMQSSNQRDAKHPASTMATGFGQRLTGSPSYIMRCGNGLYTQQGFI
jgi:hypothetical protein